MARADIRTYFTRADGVTRLLYSANEQIRVRLSLENAGPVSIGTDEDLSPVLGGTGAQLTTDKEERFILSKGDRLFIIAETINRVKVIIEPIPYTPEILALMKGANTRERYEPDPSVAPPTKTGPVIIEERSRPAITARPAPGSRRLLKG